MVRFVQEKISEAFGAVAQESASRDAEESQDDGLIAEACGSSKNTKLIQTAEQNKNTRRRSKYY